MTSLIDAALLYAGWGWRTFPLKPRDKTPLTANGCKDATSDTAVIRGWWRRWPNANVAVATGSGLVVVDLDGDADQHWTRLHLGHGGEPVLSTAMSVTGGGGYHLWWRAPEGVEIRNSAGKVGPGIDIRGEGGYAVAPPSEHSSGRPYYWVAMPAERPLAPFPRWMVRRLVAEPPEAPTGLVRPFRRAGDETDMALRVLADECRRVAGAAEGTRHNTLFAAAAALGNLAAGGEVRVTVAGGWLLEAALASGLPRHEAEQTIADGLERGMTTPRTLGGGR